MIVVPSNLVSENPLNTSGYVAIPVTCERVRPGGVARPVTTGRSQASRWVFVSRRKLSTSFDAWLQLSCGRGTV